MSAETCVTQYVFGSYTRYIPTYIYSVLKAYPDYHVKIFVGGKLQVQEVQALSLLPNPNFSIVEEYHVDKIRKGMLPKYVRRLIPYEQYKEFKYVYHGDVDFIIIPEKPSLQEWHLAHCKNLGLPFSNAIRPSGPRISGLHFMIVKPYYDAIGDKLAHYLENYKEVEAQLVGTSDEYFTYKLLDQVFGLDPLRKEGFNRPEHGVHLALWRKSKLSRKTMSHRFDYFLEHRTQFQEVLNDQVLWDIIRTTQSKELVKEITKCREFFYALTPSMRERYCE